MCGVSWSWKRDSSSATHSGGSGERPTAERQADVARGLGPEPGRDETCAISDVVVVLPLVPVIAMYRVPGSARNPRSTSA